MEKDITFININILKISWGDYVHFFLEFRYWGFLVGECVTFSDCDMRRDSFGGCVTFLESEILSVSYKVICIFLLKTYVFEAHSGGLLWKIAQSRFPLTLCTRHIIKICICYTVLYCVYINHIVRNFIVKYGI